MGELTSIGFTPGRSPVHCLDPRTKQGLVLTNFDRLTRSVSVRYVSSADFAVGAAADEGFVEVTITISEGTRIIESQLYVIADIETLL